MFSRLYQLNNKNPVWWYIIGIPASAGVYVYVRCLGSWIFVQVKLSVVVDTTKTGIVGLYCVVTLFKARVISGVNVEYQFSSFQNTICNFVEKWNAYNVLCKVDNDTIIFDLKMVILIYI